MNRTILGAMLALPVGALAQTSITFDFYPGPDGMLGTPDDIPIVAPTLFTAQALQLTSEFATVGVRFAEPVTNDRNEILNNDTFANPPTSTEPNLFASSGALTIEFTFTIPVHSVTALIGISGGSDRMTIFNAAGASLGSAVGDDADVTLTSPTPIARVVISPETGTTPAIDNLRFEGASCYPDCNQSGNLTIADFGCFQAAFAAGNMYADCNNSGTLTIADFGCFQAAFAAGCP